MKFLNVMQTYLIIRLCDYNINFLLKQSMWRLLIDIKLLTVNSWCGKMFVTYCEETALK